MRRNPDAPPEIPGFKFLKHLGSGGFADVFLYQQEVPLRKVAIKVLRHGTAKVTADAFAAEANMMASISSHPHVVSIYGVGTAEGDRPYMVLEYCPPPHLGVRARQKPFTVSRALEVGIMIAGAVQTLHEVGVIHRDIKPANILQNDYGNPVLTDFGIAASVTTNEPISEGFSVPWAPPEQQDGTGISPQSDIFSLAATIYTFLEGHSPFVVPGTETTDFQVVHRVMRGEATPMLRADVPPQLKRVLTVAMSSQPQQRYASAADFARALQGIQDLLGITPTALRVLEREDDAAAGVIETAAKNSAEGDGHATISPVNPDATRMKLRVIEAQPVTDSSFAPGGPKAATHTATGMPTGTLSSGGDAAARIPATGADTDFDEGLDATVTPEIIAARKAAQEAKREAAQQTAALSAAPPSTDPGSKPELRAAEVPPTESSPTSGDQELTDSSVTELSPAKTRRSVPWVRVLLSLLVVVAVVLGALWVLRMPAVNTRVEEPRQVGDDPVISQQLPALAALEGKLVENKVVFTWKLPANVKADRYQVAIIDPALDAPRIENAINPSITLPQLPGQTCVEVRAFIGPKQVTAQTKKCVKSS